MRNDSSIKNIMKQESKSKMKTLVDEPFKGARAIADEELHTQSKRSPGVAGKISMGLVGSSLSINVIKRGEEKVQNGAAAKEK